MINEEYPIVEFMKKHDFLGKRSRYFKNCIIIKWKRRKRRFTDWERVQEKSSILRKIITKYNLLKEDMFDTQEMLIKIGIYSYFSNMETEWVIPNDYKEVQEYVLSLIPEWAEVKYK